MIGIWRVLRKDLLQLLEGLRGILLVLVLPPLLLVLVGQLHVTSLPFSVLVAGTPIEREQGVFREFLALLRDVSILEVSTDDEPALDPLAAINAGDLDLLINLEGRRPEEWVMYTAAVGRLRPPVD